MPSDPTTPRDVRMRGFAERALVEDVLVWIDGKTPPLDHESIPIADACGRTLARNVTAEIDVPPFDRSAMDGYALRAGETDGASDYNPLSFQLLGQSLPGRSFAGQVTKSTAVRIMTGAPIPAGADAVVPAEYATESDDNVEITTSVSPGKHIGRIGEDIEAGTTVLRSKRRLRPQDIGVIASIGLPEVSVVRRPRVRIIVTGDELATPGDERSPDDIYESNSFVLRGLVERDGGQLEGVLHVADRRDEIAEAMTRPGTDVILVSGGSSVGAEDHAPSLVGEHGELAIHGVAMRPSSPAGIGRIGTALVFLLPGNPVSCLCAYDFFAGRATRRLGGRSHDWPYPRITATLARKISSTVGRVDYCRVTLDEEGVIPLSTSGASILSSTTRADGFVIVAASSEGYAAGTEVEVFRYDRP